MALVVAFLILLAPPMPAFAQDAGGKYRPQEVGSGTRLRPHSFINVMADANAVQTGIQPIALTQESTGRAISRCISAFCPLKSTDVRGFLKNIVADGGDAIQLPPSMVVADGGD